MDVAPPQAQATSQQQTAETPPDYSRTTPPRRTTEAPPSYATTLHRADWVLLVPFYNKHYTAKLAAGGASLLVSPIIIGLLAAFVKQSAAHLQDTASGFTDAAGFAAAGIAMFWTFAEFMTLYLSGRHRSIHPGLHVAVHSVIWLTALGSAINNTFWVQSRSFDTKIHYQEDTPYSALLALSRVQMALIAFDACLLLIHLGMCFRSWMDMRHIDIINKKYVQVPEELPEQVSVSMDQTPLQRTGSDPVPPYSRV